LAVINKEQQRAGRRATSIPTTPATLQYAHGRYGLLPWHRTLEPAIRIAETGYSITPLQRRQANWAAHVLGGSAAELFLPGGSPPTTGYVLRQPALAATLRRIAALGSDDFYCGGIARAIADDMALHGGLLTAEDLARCVPPRECEPISGSYRGRRIVTVPSPGGGPQLLLALRVLERLLSADATPDDWHAGVAQITAAVFRWREQSDSGPGVSSNTEVSTVDEDSSVADVCAALLDDVHPKAPTHLASEEPGDTTHLSVCDRDGNIVALTQSIQSLFGAKTAHPTLGFLYNNYLRTCPRRPHRFQLGPSCRPRSNASPTLVLRDGINSEAPLLALGAAGSRRITSAILQIIAGVLDRDLDLASAIAAPRVHGLSNGKVWLEAPAASERLLQRFVTKGCRPVVKPVHSYAMAAVQALHFLPGGSIHAAADPRRDGTAEIFAQPKNGYFT
jgi:gamma-glutamyltranspeptidase / glutathione hydrolase